jgi:hypothetical protein
MAVEFTRERHHVKHGPPLLIGQLGEVWTQQLIPKLPALTLLRPYGPRPTHFSKETDQRLRQIHGGSMLIWQKRFIADTLSVLSGKYWCIR